MNKPGFYLVQAHTETWMAGPFLTAELAQTELDNKWRSLYTGLEVQEFTGEEWIKV